MGGLTKKRVISCSTIKYSDYTAAFRGYPWIRFYEVWNATTHLRNSLKEAEQDIAHVVHAPWRPPLPPLPAPFPTKHWENVTGLAGRLCCDQSPCNYNPPHSGPHSTFVYQGGDAPASCSARCLADGRCNYATIFSVANITDCCSDPLCVNPSNISQHGCAWKFPTWCLLSEFCNTSAVVGGARVSTWRLKQRPAPPPPPPANSFSPTQGEMAAFMLGQTNYSFFSTSGQWIDSSWQWHWCVRQGLLPCFQCFGRIKDSAFHCSLSTKLSDRAFHCGLSVKQGVRCVQPLRPASRACRRRARRPL